ncbi:MAG: antibiotic biosynthesis monooxygenase [Halioglobus sp.]
MSFVAISTVGFPSALREEMHAVGLSMIPIAKTQPGFLSVAFHQSVDANETMMYWEWETGADHENCMRSDDWASLMSTHAELFQSEGVTFKILTYDRLA